MAWSRTSRHERGYGASWDRLRKAILQRDRRLCQPCKRKGRVTQANAVDHIKPKAKGGTDDTENLEAICDPCHADKGLRDQGKRVRPTTGADGWPLA